MPPDRSAAKISLSAIAIGNFAQHGHQECAVETIAAKVAMAAGGAHELDIGETDGARFFPRAVEPAFLDVDGDDVTLAADPLRERDGEPPGAAAEIKHGHAGPNVRALDDDCGAVRPGERAVALDQPGQSCLARDPARTRKHAPDDADECNQADESDKSDKSCDQRRDARIPGKKEIARRGSSSPGDHDHDLPPP